MIKLTVKTRKLHTLVVGVIFCVANSLYSTEAFRAFARTSFAPYDTDTETTTRTTKRTRPWADPSKEKPFYTTSVNNGNPLEYLQDDLQEFRGADDPHHILLLGLTYDQPRITVPYVAGSLSYVLGMPSSDAEDHAAFAKEEGMSILGTWSRKESLDLGVKLQLRDLVCRVVPGTASGAQGWQAKDANTGNSVWDVPSLQ